MTGSRAFIAFGDIITAPKLDRAKIGKKDILY